MRKHVAMAKAAAAILLAAAAGLGGPPSGAVLATPHSGVAGQIRGACVGIRECRRGVVEATIVIRNRSSGRRVRTIHTRHGRFRATLRPGSYRLSARQRHGSLRTTRAVDVPPRRYVLVVLDLGSRLRVRPR